MNYGDIKDPNIDRPKRRIQEPNFTEWVVIVVLAFLVGIIAGAVSAKAQTPETHDAMPIEGHTYEDHKTLGATKNADKARSRDDKTGGRDPGDHRRVGRGSRDDSSNQKEIYQGRK